MKSPLFDIIYIDKFRDPTEVLRFNQKAKQRFKLSDGALHLLGTGDPILIKKQQRLARAKTYREVIENMGGVCWYQPAAVDGRYSERRLRERRDVLDRRAQFRASGAMSDRRIIRGRRSTDQN